MGGALGLTRDGYLLFAGRALRTFGFGALSVVLAFFLKERGLTDLQIGVVLTVTLIEDALLTTLLTIYADRVGRRRILILTSLPIVVAGIILAVAEQPWLVMAAVVLGTLSPSGYEAGPFSALEQAMLPDTVRPNARTRAFAWYNIAGFLPAALGALAAGQLVHLASDQGLSTMSAYHSLLWVYAAVGLLQAVVFAGLSHRVEHVVPKARRREAGPRWSVGLHRSRTLVRDLAGLQAIDAFAGGFVVQTLVAYWFNRRYGVTPETLGPLFFFVNLLSAVSLLAAGPLAERFGLLNTMVWTHLPASFLFILIPLMPTYWLAAGVLLVRHMFAQIDVPTRQAWAMALVAPDERSATAGVTTSARAIAQAVAPAFTGYALAHAATGLPFFLAGGIKIIYDIALLRRFGHIPLQPEALQPDTVGKVSER